MTLRADLKIITDLIRPNTKVLDLGCGDGSLLHYLNNHKQVTSYGMEIDPQNIEHCISRGVNVIQSNLDEGLSAYFADHSFDYVILTQTLQAVHYPVQLLSEMLRVGNEGIITFPNIAHWRSRIQLMFTGKLPVTDALPNQWFDTPNIHLCSLNDFEHLCAKQHIQITERIATDFTHGRTSLSVKLLPNLFAETALYRITKNAQ